MLKQRFLNVPAFIRKALVSWLAAAAFELSSLPETLRDPGQLQGLGRMSFPRLLGVWAGLTALLCLFSHFVRTEKAERWAMAAAFGLLAAEALEASFTWPFLAACLLVGAILMVYALRGWDGRAEASIKEEKDCRIFLWITAGMAVGFFLFVSAWTVGRVRSFSTPTYDFGIFSQMFFYLKESGLPMTTVERDGPLSHFAVHVSPIYYLMLPVYWLFPFPVTLQVLQAAVITSAVIPLWKLGTRHGLTAPEKMLLSGLLLLYPAFSGGTGYDLHENCFLTPLLLWLFWGIDGKHWAVTAAAALLTLAVKEDAAVYVAVIGLWLTVRSLLRYKKSAISELITGAALLSISLGWFLGVTGYLASSGDGVMTYRYENFLYGGSDSLLTVIKAVLLNPMKAVFECVEAEKLPYLALTIGPLLGLPLLTRRYENYILLIPYLLVNLMTDYPYQHDIFFQYSFGSAACLMYLAAVHLAELRLAWHRTAILAVAAVAAAGCFCAVIVPTALSYPVQALRCYGYYQQIRDTLERIPEDAAVAAGTFYTTELSQRQTLYDIRYCTREHLLEARYVVLDPTTEADFKGHAESAEVFQNMLAEAGYHIVDNVDNRLVIYRRE